MVDLIKREQALVQFDSIRKFVSGTVAEKAPILPISAQLKYNIDVVYKDASLADIPYTGSVKRYESILPFLEALQLTTNLHCRIEGRNVYLSKAQ